MSASFWSHAPANARDVSFTGRASKRHRARRLDGHNFNPWELDEVVLRPRLGYSSAGPDKDPIDSFKLARDLICRLLGVNISVGYVSILIEPDRVRVRSQYLIDLP